MGSNSYYVDSRSLRAESLGYNKVTKDNLQTVFKQNIERKAHQDMLSSNIKGVREARDSEAHPNSIPVQLYLDVTGSMGNIPALLVKDGLPHIMETMLNKGINDVALMFGAIGDHECDRFPLQVGQFESGDTELDMWLTRTYIEGGGGRNAGESYSLAWFMTNNFVTTDAWEKRKQKGFVFTIGDEPTLLNYPGSAMKEIFGDNLPQANSNYTAKELYEECSKHNHVFHIHINHGSRRTNLKEIMGQNCIETDDYTKVPEIISNIILSHISNVIPTGSKVEETKQEEQENLISETKITL